MNEMAIFVLLVTYKEDKANVEVLTKYWPISELKTRRGAIKHFLLN